MVAIRTRRVSAGVIPTVSALCLLLCPVGPASAATLYVNEGDSLQAALDAAQPGDEVVLAAGARFVGNFRLPAKPAGPVITIRSSSALPDRRITAADAGLLPTIASATVEPALIAVNTANWRLDGLQFESTKDGMYNVIYLWDATHIYMDRLLIVGGPHGQRRAIMGNGRHITLTRSHIANIWRTGEESQAFCAWDGAGPYTLTDNYLEAASQGAMFGGANSQSPDRVPADILVAGNHFSKRLEWRGQPRVVKNLFELKSARRVVVRNNLFERNWTDAQNGFAILFTVRNDEGGAPWSVIEDVLFEQNVIRDTEGVFNILGYDRDKPSGRTTRVTIRNNLAVASGTFLLAGSEVGTLTIDHNTIVQGWNFATLYYGDVWVAGTSARRPAQYAVESLTITNTIGNHSAYGVFGEGAGIGTPALRQLTVDYVWTHNVLAGEQSWGHPYPMITWQPAMAEHLAQFNADYTLAPFSWYRGSSTEGLDLGLLEDTGSSTPPPPEPAPDPQPEPGPEPAPAPQPEPEPDPEPAPGPGDQTDTEGPEVRVRVITQNANLLKLRIDATDRSGVGLVEVWFRGQLVRTATRVPVDADVALRGLPSGAYQLVIRVVDTLGNETTLDRTVTK